ncbi:hypothetical protein GJW-30_1_03814 [Variibacter gotjawalensis]|uniref:Uncharacterized protein n=1 Tax=Variibacter gotjawalensis TaxID=1333996 RepID=A0A0S3PZ91_9BRAD|nr:hypothetical protein [Variibacter gotjawalensis]NIK47095.1 hypothetical protein [Variibacter gotjawalensis]RZS48997.1 hypothetical protein EV661_1421 [Variibacter gotjawalensis]BAT61257.1 hypothetical protein GJW-30_1_03814 [Variibacter gotjawalensis]
MGTIIKFPNDRRVASTATSAIGALGQASVTILPVIRVERPNEISARTPSGHGRR